MDCERRGELGRVDNILALSKSWEGSSGGGRGEGEAVAAGVWSLTSSSWTTSERLRTVCSGSMGVADNDGEARSGTVRSGHGVCAANCAEFPFAEMHNLAPTRLQRWRLKWRRMA